MLPRTGVLMQNRGASFSLEPGALNALEPGRLPFHTLNPALAVLADGRIIAYGAMGGDGQPQTQAALFTRHVRYRAPLEQRARRARAGSSAGPGARPISICAWNGRFDGTLVDRLISAGHDVEVYAGCLFRIPWAMPARWCCTRTERSKARTIRAPTAARPGYKIALARAGSPGLS